MSVVGQDGIKIDLPRTGPDCFWDQIHKHYACERKTRWKHLAMLALHENAGWPLEKIGKAFGHSKGHVSRCLVNTRDELHQKFRIAPEENEAQTETDSSI